MKRGGDRPLLIGLFPGLEAVGGVQASGRLAAEACLGMTDIDSRFVCYTSAAHGTLASGAAQRTRHAATRTRALLAAWQACSGPTVVLVWHIGLLRMLPLPRLGRARIVLFLHGIEAWRGHDLFTNWWLNRVDLFVTNSLHTWREFITRAPRLKSAAHVIVRLGIGDGLAPECDPLVAPPVAAMIGRTTLAENYKGHREVIDAWPLVLRQLPDAQLCVAGDGDLRTRLEDLSQARGVSQSVRFLGEVSDHDKEQLLAHARCLLLPSRGEGFGLVYLEAMRHGRPCLVSAVDAGREVVNPPEAGLAADPSNRAGLAEATCRLLSTGAEWEVWSRQARERYAREFTAQHFQDRLRAALTPLLGPRSQLRQVA